MNCYFVKDEILCLWAYTVYVTCDMHVIFSIRFYCLDVVHRNSPNKWISRCENMQIKKIMLQNFLSFAIVLWQRQHMYTYWGENVFGSFTSMPLFPCWAAAVVCYLFFFSSFYINFMLRRCHSILGNFLKLRCTIKCTLYFIKLLCGIALIISALSKRLYGITASLRIFMMMLLLLSNEKKIRRRRRRRKPHESAEITNFLFKFFPIFQCRFYYAKEEEKIDERDEMEINLMTEQATPLEWCQLPWQWFVNFFLRSSLAYIYVDDLCRNDLELLMGNYHWFKYSHNFYVLKLLNFSFEWQTWKTKKNSKLMMMENFSDSLFLRLFSHKCSRYF